MTPSLIRNKLMFQVKNTTRNSTNVFYFFRKSLWFWPKVICNFRPINKVLCSFIKSQHVWIILKYNKRTWSRRELARFKKECSIGKLQNSLIFGSWTMSSKALVIIFQWEQILTKLNKFQVFSYCIIITIHLRLEIELKSLR